MRFLQWVLLGSILANCSGGKENNAAYFGGHILNPKSKTVYLYKDFKLIDSAKLSTDAKFAFKVNSDELGLYRFEHGTDFQVIYLKPEDSLLLRLNTWDFDESMVFSGKGAERNNFLINLYVSSVNENRVFRKYYRLDEMGFEKAIDSIISGKKALFENFKKDVNDRSPEFDKLVEAGIFYPLYEKKEMYPYRQMRYKKLDSLPKLEPNFYNFRDQIDLNDKTLAAYFPHNLYVRTYLHQKAWKKKMQDTSCFEVNFMQYTLEELEIEPVRNTLLREGIWKALMNHDLSMEDKAKAQRLFYDHCSDTLFTAKMSKLIKASERIKKGSTLPSLSLNNMDNNQHLLADVIKGKNTVVYTWPTSKNAINNFAKRINYLEKTHPEFLFVGVNSKNDRNAWIKHVTNKRINSTHQFMPTEPIYWLDDIDFPIAILIDENGIVQNHMTHLSYSKFKDQLKALANRNSFLAKSK